MGADGALRAPGESPLVRRLAADDEACWRQLWSAYAEFYGTLVGPEVGDHLWRRLVSGCQPYLGLAATLSGELVGFAHVIAHPVTFSIREAAYLEDLFVAPAHRRRGVASALIKRLIELAETEGWSRLYWHTAADNFTARRLYDGFIPADEAVRYRISFG